MGQNNPSTNLGTGPTWPIPPGPWAYVDSPTCRKNTGLFFESLRCEFQVLGLWHQEHRPTGWVEMMEGCLVEKACCKLLQGNTIRFDSRQSNFKMIYPCWERVLISHLWKRKIIRIQLLLKGIVLVCLVEVLPRLTMGYHASMSTGHNGVLVAWKCMKSCNFGYIIGSGIGVKHIESWNPQHPRF